MFLDTALKILLGIGLLFGGGELFIQGAVGFALIFSIPQLVIGLTVVSLGTSAPELFVSITSVLNNSDSLAINNVVGSNIFNVMVVLGSSALVMPLRVESRLVRRDVPVLLAVSTAVWGMSSAGRITWQAGLALLLSLVINTIWEIRTAREEYKETESVESKTLPRKWQWIFLQLLSGSFLLIIGSRILVEGAVMAASLLGVSEAVIGLTIVSAGTSIPELVASLIATLRNRTDLAIGNVVGSNLLNQLLVLGSTAVVSGKSGVNVESVLINRDLPIMVITTLACMPIFWTRGSISRLEGGFLVGLYIFYLVDQVLPYMLPTWQDKFRIVLLCLVLPAVIVAIIAQSISYWQYLRRQS